MTLQELAIYAAVVLAFSGWAAWQILKRVERFARKHRGLIGFVAGFSVGRAQRQRGRAPARPPLAGDDMWAACPLSRWGKVDRNLYACRWCNGPLPERADEFCGQQCRDIARGNHYFAEARKLRRWTDSHRCTECGKTGSGVTIEVDHIVAVLGRHNTPGCWHHQQGLRSLCGGGGESCHQKNTNRQRRAGEFGRRRRAS